MIQFWMTFPNKYEKCSNVYVMYLHLAPRYGNMGVEHF